MRSLEAFNFPIASTKPRHVAVFECPQDIRRDKDASSISAVKSDREIAKETDDVREEFKEIMNNVKDFALAHSERKEKKELEAKRIEELGGKRARNVSTPYNILIGLRKAAAKRDKRRAEEQRKSDIVSKKVKKSAHSKPVRTVSRKVDYGVQATKGKFRNGILDVRELM